MLCYQLRVKIPSQIQTIYGRTHLLALGHEEHRRGDLNLTLGNLRGHLATSQKAKFVEIGRESR